EDSLRYNARDVAIVRAQFVGAKIVLGSATPSLESYYNAHNDRYLYVTLKNRIDNRPMPKTIFVDIKEKAEWYADDLPWISRVLVNKMRQTLAKGQQSMLYLNRLGYAHFLFCKDCGETWHCKNCDVSLTYYRHPPALKCHYCGIIFPVPAICDHCQGNGLET